ncbi:hypothetical protein IPV08_22955 [Methylobacterium sp. SD274]|uniref:hypothetical protein n=1 Tax=Methylobacterium sp. SD274 TaxID=2782009 RepID=UPI001A96D8D9|nr:hypothetical protein [Methylobacterium sp. SD274]MBO1022822.1 hypothetical protein [Methylobacterium sp. SD274]
MSDIKSVEERLRILEISEKASSMMWEGFAMSIKENHPKIFNMAKSTLLEQLTVMSQDPNDQGVVEQVKFWLDEDQ